MPPQRNLRALGIICWPELLYANARDQSGKLAIVDRKLPDRKPIYFYEWHATRTSSAFFNNIWPSATFDYLPQLRIFLPHTSGRTAILTKNVSIFSPRLEYWVGGTLSTKYLSRCAIDRHVARRARRYVLQREFLSSLLDTNNFPCDISQEKVAVEYTRK